MLVWESSETWPLLIDETERKKCVATRSSGIRLFVVVQRERRAVEFILQQNLFVSH